MALAKPPSIRDRPLNRRNKKAADKRIVSGFLFVAVRALTQVSANKIAHLINRFSAIGNDGGVMRKYMNHLLPLL